MGLLKQGTVLTWEETKERTNAIKRLGVDQFLRLWEAESMRHGDEHKWGDEIEYMLVHFDHKKKNAMLAICQDETLEKLNASLSDISPGSRLNQPAFVTEFTRYQIETSPGVPYTSTFADLLLVENNMRQRRTMIRQHLGPNESPITLSSFPRLGASGIFTCPQLPVSENGSGESLTVAERLTASHSRYQTIKANMAAKRGSKLLVNVPIYVDTCTANPFFDPIYSAGGTNHQGRIFLDSVIFGAGCCCMQVTQQLQDLSQARRIYDALLPLAPLMLALSASSPAWRGYLCDIDCRWNVASSCLDERTPTEIQEQQRPRWDVSGMYIAIGEENKPHYNDVPVPYDERAYEKLKERGMDDLLSRYVASLFSRDPLIAYSDDFEDYAAADMNHFNNINSSVWQALRLKPPQGSSMGWRVEFRTTEASITDFESAAYAIFIILLSRTILYFDLNLYIPISKVVENMHVAQRRNAAREESFSFRTDILNRRQEVNVPTSPKSAPEYKDMSIDEIFNGSRNFSGLLTFVEKYVEEQNPDEETKSNLSRYLDFIRGKTNGTYVTTAAWIRNFVRTHRRYRFDSSIDEEIGYDLMMAIDEISREEKGAPELLPV